VRAQVKILIMRLFILKYYIIPTDRLSGSMENGEKLVNTVRA